VSGFTLVELMVAMTVMVIIMSIVVDAVSDWVVNSERRVTNGGQASAAVEAAFMTLDGEVRYAADISTPAESMASPYAGSYWVEFQSDWTIPSQGAARCTQLEYNTTAGTLQQRTWLSGATPPTGWLVLASGLSTTLTTPAHNPFSLSQTAASLLNPSTPPTTASATPPPVTVAATPPWQLSVTLSSTQGKGVQADTAASSFAITALDITSTSVSVPAQVCGGNPL
jgi:prepilin-type N-terminal cleavage/methylation domain-containing protein